MDTMESDSLFEDMPPNIEADDEPFAGTAAFGDQYDEGLQVRAKARWSFYLEVTGLTASDGVCDLTGTNEDSLYIFGYVGPYVNADSENVCGALFTLNDDVLTQESDSDLQIDIGDLDETMTFTLSYALSRWTDKSDMEADSLYTALSSTPQAVTVDWDESDDDKLAVQAEAGDTIYLEVLELSDSDDDCEL